MLVFTVVCFALLHIAPAVPAAKSVLQSTLGKAYGPLYGIGSLALLIAMIWAFRGADRTELYDPPTWGRHANFILTLIAFICIGIFVFRGSWRNDLRFPMALAVWFWGTGHLLANGDSASIILFAGLMTAATVQVLLASGRNHETVVRQGHNLLSVLAGIAMYGVFAQLHGVLIGVPVLTLVR